MRGLLPLLGGLLLCTTVHAGDWRPSTSHQSPSQNPDPIVPEVQTDDFSCGFHALSAISKLLLLLILALTAWISFKILRFAARTLRRRHSAPVS